MKNFRMITILVALACAFPIGASAQVVREEGVKSIAGVVYTDPSYPTYAEWTFQSAGGEVLFATLDADIYRKTTHESDHAVTAAAAADEHEDDGGPGLFKLKVLDAYGNALCEAKRPAPPPGWQRDPRLACALPTMRTRATYKIRVEFANPSGETVQPYYPFLLNFSLRKIAPSGTNVQSAVAASSAGGF